MYSTLQSYATHFAQKEKKMAEIKNSIDNMNYKMENTVMQFQDLDTWFDLMGFGLREIDFQSSRTVKIEHLAL